MITFVCESVCLTVCESVLDCEYEYVWVCMLCGSVAVSVGSQSSRSRWPVWCQNNKLFYNAQRARQKANTDKDMCVHTHT